MNYFGQATYLRALFRAAHYPEAEAGVVPVQRHRQLDALERLPLGARPPRQVARQRLAVLEARALLPPPRQRPRPVRRVQLRLRLLLLLPPGISVLGVVPGVNSTISVRISHRF